MSCNTNTKPSKKTIASTEIIVPKVITKKREAKITEEFTDLYEIILEVNAIDTDAYELVINVDLKTGSYYISPNATRNFKMEV